MKLELREVDVSLGGCPVLRALCLCPPPFQALALIGPSGGGKSTLLRLVAGLVPYHAGLVTIEDETLPSNEAALRAYRRHVGIVFQAHNLFPHWTALDNVSRPLELVHGLAKEQARAQAMHELERLGLAGLAHRRPHELSGGQQQRVALARALAPGPRLLLFDEPTSALDPVMTAEVLRAIERLKNEGHRFLIVTHALGFARRVADRVAFVSGGQVSEEAAVEAFFSQPTTPEARQFLETVLRYG